MFVRVASSLVLPRYLTFEPEVFSSHGRQLRHPFPSMCVVQWLWYIMVVVYFTGRREKLHDRGV